MVKIHPLEKVQEDQAPKKIEGACDSPSSDKENASQENQKKEQPKEEENARRESLCKANIFSYFLTDAKQMFNLNVERFKIQQ